MTAVYAASHHPIERGRSPSGQASHVQPKVAEQQCGEPPQVGPGPAARPPRQEPGEVVERVDQPPHVAQQRAEQLPADPEQAEDGDGDRVVAEEVAAEPRADERGHEGRDPEAAQPGPHDAGQLVARPPVLARRPGPDRDRPRPQGQGGERHPGRGEVEHQAR